MAASGYTQASRALRIDTPLGPNTLLLRSVSGQEAVSQLFRFQVELLSENDSISFDSSRPHRLFNVGDVAVEAIWVNLEFRGN